MGAVTLFSNIESDCISDIDHVFNLHYENEIGLNITDITNMHEITLGLLVGSQYYNVRNELDNHITIIMYSNQK